jgi:hypothetical protein
MAEKRDIIMRLRALMERGPGSGGGGGGGAGGRKVVDETAAAERGMNEQMSLLELRERLAVAQRRQREEVGARGYAAGPACGLCRTLPHAVPISSSLALPLCAGNSGP